MTTTIDTTDIAALLNELRVTATEKAGESEVARRVLILFGQIEAERQRAEKAEAELEVLKGDHVPVGVWCIQEVTGDDGSLSRTEFLSVTDGVKIPKDAPLFTAPQKPIDKEMSDVN